MNSFRSLLLFTLTIFTLQILAVCEANAADTKAPPNVVYIISDDQAWGDYSFMGHPHIKTPHIDRLAKESHTFYRGYVPDSLCRPSLATMVTGLYPHQHGIVGNDPPPPAELKGKPKRVQFRSPEYRKIREEYIGHIDKAPRLAEMLKAKGYISHQSGKWWEGHYSRGGFTHGMTHGDRSKGGRHGDKGLEIGRKGMKPVFDFVDMAQKENKPFFVYYAPFLPHTPHNPPKRLLDKYRNQTPYISIAKYWAMCEWFDETVGELLDYLDKNNLAENTIVLYACDNGWITRTDNSRYAARSKRSQYDGGLRTPIMVRWPGHIAPKQDRKNLANTIDMVPTVLDAVGLEPTEEMQGISLLDLDAIKNRKAIFGEVLEHDIQHMTDPVASLKYLWVIEGQWKLIQTNTNRLPGHKFELYNIVNDPKENRDKAEEKKEIVERLSKKIANWWPEGAK